MPKTCRKCNRPEGVVTFGTVHKRGKTYPRGVCRDCMNRQARGEPAADSIVDPAPTAPSPVEGWRPAPHEPEVLLRVGDRLVEPSIDQINAERAAEQHRRLEAKKQELIFRENDRLKAELDVLKQIKAAPPAIFAPAQHVLGDAVAVMVGSDWHLEESVEAHKVHGLNEYNLAIAEKRAQHFFKNGLRLAQIMARDCKIDTLFLYLGGDFFSNFIHDELRETNNLGPADAANFAMHQLDSGIRFLLRESSFRLDIDAIPGNHGRMTLKPRIQNATETSLESFMYHALAAGFRDEPRVSFRVAQSKMLYRQYFEKFTMRLIHGDDVKFGGGVGGITIPIRKKIAAWDKAARADLTVMGHFHQFLDGGDFLVNGSLIGYNEFAQAIGASPEEARQAFFLIHARNGGQKSIVAPIWLDDAHKT